MVVGNEFTLPQRKPRPIAPVVRPVAVHVPVPVMPALDTVELAFEKVPHRRKRILTYPVELFHRYSLGAFALLFLIVGASAITVAGSYKSAQITLATNSISALRIPAQPLRGPNMTIASSQTQESLGRIMNQPLGLTVGSNAAKISPETIKTWMKVVTDTKKGVSYIHVDEAAIGKSLTESAAPFVKTASDQVTVAYADGTSRVIVAGKNGTKLGDTLAARRQIAQSLLSAKGLQANIPLDSLVFASVTPAAFDKMIEIDVNAKQMWLYQKGQLVKQYPISAGAPETPTPLGQYKIFSKLAVQDMRGLNADGTKYFQPNVKWVNYYQAGGYAIHGNYWRPQSWFGVINSSHGCTSLPEAQAKEVYDWAPIGTTVIVHS